jgi:nicotinate-nucleotide pyrophosphorylase (carboxylating)
MNNTIDTLIDIALEEDIGTGDVTTEATIDKEMKCHALVGAKEELVVSGLDIARRVFEKFDPSLKWHALKKDGDLCVSGDVLAELDGSAASFLTAERTALNFVRHLSGVATFTQKFVKAVEGTGVKIIETRKTLPGLRVLEKQAVLHGGGDNHRMGLYDRYLIKNNHIDIVGNVTAAIKMVKKHNTKNYLIEIEVRHKQELETALEEGVDIIMLDNWRYDRIDMAIKLIAGRAKIELSGGITLDTIKHFARQGIDYISIGALTHSAPSADINLQLYRV